jgi:hypothetical protein
MGYNIHNGGDKFLCKMTLQYLFLSTLANILLKYYFGETSQNSPKLSLVLKYPLKL